MEIIIDVSDIELTSDDKTLIQNCLGLSSGEMNEALTKLCKTAFMEYLKMFKEKGLPTRADEVQQERLFFLISYFFKDRFPSENDVSSIFQLTPSQSRTLLRNTKSRYRTKIGSFVKRTLLETINSATQQSLGIDYEFVCLSPIIVEELNSIVSQKGPELKPIEKIRGIASKYTLPADTRDLLMQELR